MFVIRNVSKLLFGETSKQDLLQIDSGQLYLIRPKSPKGYSECIFKESAAYIRRTSTSHHYQLVIQRIFEEGEEHLQESDDEDNANDRAFLLDESLRFRSGFRDGQAIFAWKDILGDPEDTFEFICDTATQPGQITTFEIVAMQCQFERKYQRSYETATDADLEQFSFTTLSIPPLSPPGPPTAGLPQVSTTPPPTKKASRFEEAVDLHQTDHALYADEEQPDDELLELPRLAKESVELHLYDVDSGTFILQASDLDAHVLDHGSWSYSLRVIDPKGLQEWIHQAVIPDISPVFNFDYLSFIFNAYKEDNTAFSWLLRFPSMDSLGRFQEGLMRALWEHLNQASWLKAKEDDRDYIVEAFQDITMTDASDDEPTQSEHSDNEAEDDSEAGDDSMSEAQFPDDGNSEENSQLAVGYKTDRSFVIRGSRIGVFKHTPTNQLQFSTTINKVQTPKGKLFEPKKVMLHAGDTSMVLQNQANPHSVYKMDIETGKVVDEWKVHDDIPITNYLPETKFSQLTDEQTFIGHSKNALFRVDPRLSGNKMVGSELKQYVSKNEFSAAATTEKGYIAVASNKGDIRLFDRLGINAKSHLPALGDPIIGIDVSANGRWILATCRTYLLLIDAKQDTGKNAGKLGFEKGFGKDAKPKPRRLALSPSHVAQFQHETKTPLSFTIAKFNTGLDSEETSIVTSTGPFIITWDMKKTLKGLKEPYSIRRYAEEVKADNFRFGSDKSVIVALPQQVDMVAKGSFRKPTRQSISTPIKQLRSRSSIVNSPY
ncbi:Vacuolar import and degradation protein [Drechslerella dactyloides]|uniref:Vacuolar import and degradation protein n=1 Tax=Drechslerella dactyloides TaxID=74499 RepID=A0AAD6J2W1_DREDA|nr:Vacuolar import and degradation protein [Drechslerella dactyloides]